MLFKCQDLEYFKWNVLKFQYLSLRGIRGTEHTPLGGLKWSRPRHFASLLKLRVDTCHHTQGRDVGQPWEHLRHSLSLHLEPLYGPVPLQHNIINTFPTFLVEDKTNMHTLCKWVILIIKPSVTRFWRNFSFKKSAQHTT